MGGKSTYVLQQRLDAALATHEAALKSVKLKHDDRWAIKRSMRALTLAIRDALRRLAAVQRAAGTARHVKAQAELRLLRRMLKMRSFDHPDFRRRMAQVEAVRRVQGVNHPARTRERVAAAIASAGEAER